MLLQRYALRAEWYVWQCWKAQNLAEYMLALAGYQQAASGREPTWGDVRQDGANSTSPQAAKPNQDAASSGYFFDSGALMKLWLPTLTGRVVSLGSSLTAAKILLETPDEVVQASG